MVYCTGNPRKFKQMEKGNLYKLIYKNLYKLFQTYTNLYKPRKFMQTEKFPEGLVSLCNFCNYDDAFIKRIIRDKFIICKYLNHFVSNVIYCSSLFRYIFLSIFCNAILSQFCTKNTREI